MFYHTSSDECIAHSKTPHVPACTSPSHSTATPALLISLLPRKAGAGTAQPCSARGGWDEGQLVEFK